LANLAILDDRPLNADAAFIRFDVFEYLDSQSYRDYQVANSWYTAIQGWLLSNPNIRILNRDFSKQFDVNKMRTLALARTIGMKIPETYVTNDLIFINKLIAEKDFIHKPIEGGEHAEELAKYDIENLKSKTTDYPFFVQEKLIQPELRIFRVGDVCLGFWVISDYLDYRSDANTKLEYTEVSSSMSQKVIELTNALGLNFSALDFKTCPKTGELLLLEANSSPMFTAFDQACDGKVCNAIIDYLLN
jgi:glutathione synthase/RimK-type ligase-like ATP-grasp enzyme